MFPLLIWFWFPVPVSLWKTFKTVPLVNPKLTTVSMSRCPGPPCGSTHLPSWQRISCDSNSASPKRSNPYGVIQVKQKCSKSSKSAKRKSLRKSLWYTVILNPLSRLSRLSLSCTLDVKWRPLNLVNDLENLKVFACPFGTISISISPVKPLPQLTRRADPEVKLSGKGRFNLEAIAIGLEADIYLHTSDSSVLKSDHGIDIEATRNITLYMIHETKAVAQSALA